MTDYVKALHDVRSPYHREARGKSGRLLTEATITGGVIRWNSNGRVPPAECVALAVEIGLPVDAAKCTAERDRETSEFLAAYRANHQEPTDEECFEMRAAFGPGVDVVNIVTGRRHRT